jgi:hypothetical protein
MGLVKIIEREREGHNRHENKKPKRLNPKKS